MSDYPKYEPEMIHNDLKNILPEEALSGSIFERINNALDPYTFASDVHPDEVPYIVVRPGSTKEVSTLMQYADSRKIPVYVRGSGTSLHGASSYRHKGIVLNVSRLTHLNVMQEDGFMELGPGHRVLHVKEELEKKGYFLPLVPGSIRVASVGGLICNNTSAHAVDSCIGKPRDYVLGLEAVLPNGEIIETGTKSLRRQAGTDLTHYFVGGDGLLGVITGIRMRLVPAFKNAFGIAFFENLESLVRSVQRIYLEKAPPPLFLEFLDQKVGELTFQIQGLQAPPGPLIMFHAIGHTEDEAADKIRRLVDVIRKESPIEARRIDDLEEWRKVWLARESALPYVCQAGKGVFALSEVVSTVSDLGNCFKDVRNMSAGMPTLEKLGDPYIFGHIGALTFHPVFIIPIDWPTEEKAKVIDEMFFRESEINQKYATSGGEWGQFARRTPFYRKRYGEKAFDLVRGIKKLFDPNYILNPDVLPNKTRSNE